MPNLQPLTAALTRLKAQFAMKPLTKADARAAFVRRVVDEHHTLLSLEPTNDDLLRVWHLIVTLLVWAREETGNQMDKYTFIEAFQVASDLKHL